jgi:small-conductance mechanosensitive channel
LSSFAGAWAWAQNDASVALFRIGGVVLIACVLTILLKRAVRRMERKVAQHTTPMRALQRTNTLTSVLSSAGIALIWFLASLYLIQTLGFNLAPLLTGVGIVGLALGFGAQNLVRDVFSGLFVLIEDQYGVGDSITINSTATGTVEQLTLRVTGVRDLYGTVHYVANGAVTQVSNMSKGWARAVVDFPVDASEDPQRVRDAFERVAEEAGSHQSIVRKLYGEPKVLGLQSFDGHWVSWRMVVDTKPGRQVEVERSLRELIKMAFDAEGIKTPTAGGYIGVPGAQDETGTA